MLLQKFLPTLHKTIQVPESTNEYGLLILPEVMHLKHTFKLQVSTFKESITISYHFSYTGVDNFVFDTKFSRAIP